jgi:hypothetical protein
MSKRQPVKNTSGGGFTFEDQFGAYLGAALLAGVPVTDPEHGGASRIDFQTGADGWRLDDVLVRFQNGSRLCASVKSYPQVARSSAKADFVERAWEELCGSSGSGFNPERDLLGMVTAPLDQASRNDLQELIRLARAQDAADLARHLEEAGFASPSRRRLWRSFKRPEIEALLGVRPDITQTGELVRLIRIFEVDFEASPSHAESEAIVWCRDALQDPAEAQTLWEALLRMVASVRTAGGYLDSQRLRDALGERFRLRVAPSYRADWEVLKRLSATNLGLVTDTLGGRLRLTREGALMTMGADITQDDRFIALVGPSGLGKTVLAKLWAEPLESLVLWLRPEDLAQLTSAATPLGHPFGEVLRSATQLGWIVIEGLDRTFGTELDRGVSHLVTLIRDDSGVPFRLLVTAQQQAWPQIAERLATNNALTQWKVLPAPPIDDGELQAVYGEFPGLAATARRSRLSGALHNLKVLDVALRRLNEGAKGSRSAGDEVSIAQWFWDHVARGNGAKSAQRAAFLLRLAERQADSLQTQTPLQEVNASDLEVLDDLEGAGVLQLRDDRVGFVHDLYGDWVRLRLIRGNTEDLRKYVEARLTSPLWHRAVRLHALDLLDGDDTATAWSEGLRRASHGQPDLVDDLFLEAPLFAAEPEAALARIWPKLVAEDGVLLRRLLGRFRHIATVPNPSVIESVRQAGPDLEVHASTLQRLPFWPLWLPLLTVLGSHQEEATRFAPEESAEVVDAWLRLTPTNWPLRVEAAAIAISVARARIADKNRGSRATEGLEKATWRALLAAVQEKPVETREIAASLVGSVAGQLASQRSSSPTARTSLPRRRVSRPDDAFLHVCLDADGLHPVIAADPELASELLFSLLAPRGRPRIGILGDATGMERLPGWLLPLYIRGPFLAFLRRNSELASRLIVRLADAATDHWVASRADDGEAAHPWVIDLDPGDLLVYGDEQVLVWYRGDGRASSVLASALMALEKWLYDESDAGHDIGPTVSEILRSTRSAAVVGLLTAVGCRHPELLKGPLRPLLGAWQILMWDRDYKATDAMHLRIGLFTQPVEFRKLADEWYALKHRHVPLLEHATWLALTEPQFAEFFRHARERWLALASPSGSPTPVDYLAAQLDPGNWRRAIDTEGKDYIYFEAPEVLRRDSEEASRHRDSILPWLSTPIRMRMVLEGKTTTEIEELEKLLRTLQGAGSAPTDEMRFRPLTDDDSLCAVAAVLVVHHQSWLQEHPDDRRWCVETLVGAVSRERPPSPFGFDSDGSGLSWGAFCADALPLLWAEDPNEKELSEAIARLAAAFSDTTVGRLFQSASSVRQSLSDDFVRLQHLAIKIATWRVQMDRRRLFGSDTVDANSEIDDAIQGFIDKSLEPKVPTWSQVAIPEAPVGGRHHAYDIDLQYLQAAYSWMPDFDEALDSSERDDWLAFWQQSVDCMAKRLREDIDPKRQEVDGTPWESEYHLLHELPARIVQLNGPQAALLWRPVLDLGPAAHYWVESFLDSWMLVGLSGSPTERFVMHWKAMLKHVHENELWDSKRSYGTAELHARLMGIGGIATSSWTADTTAVAAQMADEFEHWASQHLHGDWVARDLARFLSKPGADPLLARGLAHLNIVDESITWHGSEGSYYDALASLLVVVFQRHREITRTGDPAGVAYRSLLVRLAGRQNPVAMELMSRMPSSS